MVEFKTQKEVNKNNILNFQKNLLIEIRKELKRLNVKFLNRREIYKLKDLLLSNSNLDFKNNSLNFYLFHTRGFFNKTVNKDNSDFDSFYLKRIYKNLNIRNSSLVEIENFYNNLIEENSNFKKGVFLSVADFIESKGKEGVSLSMLLTHIQLNNQNITTKNLIQELDSYLNNNKYEVFYKKYGKSTAEVKYLRLK